jgi:hypothetical protein
MLGGCSTMRRFPGRCAGGLWVWGCCVKRVVEVYVGQYVFGWFGCVFDRLVWLFGVLFV